MIDIAKIGSCAAVHDAELIAVQVARYITESNFHLVQEVIDDPEPFDLIRAYDMENLDVLREKNYNRFLRAMRVHQELLAFKRIIRVPVKSDAFFLILKGRILKACEEFGVHNE